MNEGIFQEHIQNYLEQFAPPSDEHLEKMEVYALKNDVPIIGPHVGALLYVLAKISNAKRILELGSAIGYSGIWLARALPKNGRLVTIEWDHDTAEVAKTNFKKAGVWNMIDLKTGTAQDIIMNIDGDFDFVFNDIDKEGYVDILPHCLAHLRKGGLLVTDNVLRNGNVAKKPSNEDDLETVTIREFNRRICSNPDLLTIIIPIRDGISISMKL